VCLDVVKEFAPAERHIRITHKVLADFAHRTRDEDFPNLVLLVRPNLVGRVICRQMWRINKECNPEVLHRRFLVHYTISAFESPLLILKKEVFGQFEYRLFNRVLWLRGAG
jgi:hypothetical protein